MQKYLMGILFTILISDQAVEERIRDPQGKLTRLINLTSGETKELVKPFIHDRQEYGFANATRLLEKQYRNRNRLLAFNTLLTGRGLSR